MGDSGKIGWLKLETDSQLDDSMFGPGAFPGDTFTASSEIHIFQMVSTIGLGRSSAAVTAAPTDELLCFPASLCSSGRARVPQGSFFEQRDSGRSIKTYPRRSVCRRPRSLVDDAAKMKMEPPVNLYGEFARFTQVAGMLPGRIFGILPEPIVATLHNAAAAWSGSSMPHTSSPTRHRQGDALQRDSAALNSSRRKSQRGGEFDGGPSSRGESRTACRAA